MKNVIRKLKEKHILSSKEYKNGRGSWNIYEISEEVFSQISENEYLIQESMRETMYESMFDPPYSNSNIYNKYNTTIQLQTQFEKIDISPLQQIGFRKKHLLDLQEYVSAEVLQESINHFAWGIKNNPENYEKYKNPLFTFIGVLKKGNPWIESSYKSEEDLIAEKMLMLKRQRIKQREKTIQDFLELDFPDWKESLSKEQVAEIIPSNFRDSLFRETTLKEHFKKYVLIPKLKKEGAIQTDYE